MDFTLLKLGASALRAQQTQLDLVGHNLANLQTTGFRAVRAELTDLPPAEHTYGVEDPWSLVLADDPAQGAAVARTLQPNRPGPVVETGQPLDVALPPGVYLAVQLPNGEVAYTRNGRLHVNNERRLQAGDYLLQGDLEVPENAGAVAIDGQGTLRVVGAPGLEGLADATIGPLPLVRVRNPEELEALGRGVYRATPASGAPEAYTPTGQDGFLAGALESSNVQAEHELTKLIRAQRAYQASVQVVRTWDELAAQTIRDAGNAI